jgi:hypothetical protein
LTLSDRSLVARDMAGDGVMQRDWVFDGHQVWEVMAVTPSGQIACRDPYRLAAEQTLHHFDPAAVAKVRADRADDPGYLRAVYEQAKVLQDFWADES